MKPLTMAISVVAFALPLLAVAEDSPLVRAAKATGRLNKKPGVVITNDTLVATGGHLSTNGSTTPYTKPAEAYANAPMNPAPARASAAPAVQPATAGNTVQPPAATPYQPAAATTYQPRPAQTAQVGTAVTAPVSYAGTTQPEVATVKPPQP